MARYKAGRLERTYFVIDSVDEGGILEQIRMYGMLDGAIKNRSASSGKERDFVVELGENRDGRRVAEFSMYDRDLHTGEVRQVYEMISGFYPTKETQPDGLLMSTNRYLIDEIGVRLPKDYELPDVRLILNVMGKEGGELIVNLEAAVEGTMNINEVLRKMDICTFDGVSFGERARAYWQALFGIHALEYAIRCQAQVCGKATKEETLTIFLTDKLKSGIRNAFAIMINNLEDDMQEYAVILNGPLLGRMWKNPLKNMFFSEYTPPIVIELDRMCKEMTSRRDKIISKDFMLPAKFTSAPKDRERYKVIET